VTVTVVTVVTVVTAVTAMQWLVASDSGEWWHKGGAVGTTGGSGDSGEYPSANTAVIARCTSVTTVHGYHTTLAQVLLLTICDM
jgi:hypothetical protein